MMNLGDSGVLECKITQENTIIKFKNGKDGTVSTKCIDTADFCSAIGSQTVTYKMDIPRVSPSVPSCVKIGYSGNMYVYLFLYPGAMRRIYLNWQTGYANRLSADFEGEIPTEEEYNACIGSGHRENYRAFDVPYPALGVFTLIRQEKSNSLEPKKLFTEQYVVALKTTMGDPNNLAIYRFPFTNVFGDCRCCLGNILKEVTSVDGIAYFPTTIFNGLGNGDLCCSDGSHFNSDGESLGGSISSEYELITKMYTEGVKTFPSDYLKPYPNETLATKFNWILGESSN